MDRETDKRIDRMNNQKKNKNIRKFNTNEKKKIPRALQESYKSLKGILQNLTKILQKKNLRGVKHKILQDSTAS